MKISLAQWNRYKNNLSKLSNKAVEELVSWVNANGGYAAMDADLFYDYAYALVTRYGEGSASLAALMYDEVAELSGKTLPSAVVAETATYEEVTGAINNIKKTSKNVDYVCSVAGTMVKQAAADTTLKNASRDGAEFAWIPSGDTCVYCLAIAANGWKKASSKTTSHASHIHNNCDCQFAVRFDSSTTVAGYDSSKYKEIYDSAEGTTSKDKINYLRREQYAENKDEINKQKRIAYAERNEVK